MFQFAFSMFEARVMADFVRSGSVQGAVHTSALSSIERGMVLKQKCYLWPSRVMKACC